MSELAAIQLENVSKTYATGLRAVDELSLDVPHGSVFALLGASGCGKTTTLRLINRLEEPTAGRVRVRGRDVREQRPEDLRRSIGYVIQEGGLFPHMTVAANVGTVPRLLGWSRRRVNQRVAEVLDLVGLPQHEFGGRMPSELSGGQRQRVGVARALAADPDILLMDEPFGALDPGTRERIQDEFRALQAKLRKTIVFVTHDIGEAGRLADEIGLMDQGRIAQRGPLRHILLHPENERVRTFLGRHRQGLALETIRLGDIVASLQPVPESVTPIRLSADWSLGQVLAALAHADPAAGVILEENSSATYSAGSIRSRALKDLETSSA